MKTYAIYRHDDDAICIAEYDTFTEAQESHSWGDTDFGESVISREKARSMQKGNEGCIFLEKTDMPSPVLLIRGEIMSPKKSVPKRQMYNGA